MHLEAKVEIMQYDLCEIMESISFSTPFLDLMFFLLSKVRASVGSWDCYRLRYGMVGVSLLLLIFLVRSRSL
jgi:hypothetical protein